MQKATSNFTLPPPFFTTQPVETPESPESAKLKNQELQRLCDEVADLYLGFAQACVQADSTRPRPLFDGNYKSLTTPWNLPEPRGRPLDRTAASANATQRERSLTPITQLIDGLLVSYGGIPMPSDRANKHAKAGEAHLEKLDAPKPQRATMRKDPYSEGGGLFGSKSKLIGKNLTKYFAAPAAWDVLTEDEKKGLLDLFPADLPLDEHGRPSQDFLRYNNDWRNALRLFQLDLAGGRFEPGWLEEASAATKERAEGKFDDWKEQQFEEYWGQKYHTDPDLLIGNLSKVKPENMVAQGFIKAGDIWNYTRAIGRGKNRVLIDKNLRVVKISADNTVTLLIPPGSKKNAPQDDLVTGSESDVKLDAPTDHEPSENLLARPANSQKTPRSPLDLSKPLPTLPSPNKSLGTTRLSSDNKQKDDSASTDLDFHLNPRPEETRPSSGSHEDKDEAHLHFKRRKLRHRHAEPQKSMHKSFLDHANLDVSVEHTLLNLQMLERAIIQIDGRLSNWDGRGNAWKCIRCLRDGNDMGLLWDLREECFKKLLK